MLEFMFYWIGKGYVICMYQPIEEYHVRFSKCNLLCVKYNHKPNKAFTHLLRALLHKKLELKFLDVNSITNVPAALLQIDFCDGQITFTLIFFGFLNHLHFHFHALLFQILLSRKENNLVL
jgi:hypothetical protein